MAKKTNLRFFAPLRHLFPFFSPFLRFFLFFVLLLFTNKELFGVVVAFPPERKGGKSEPSKNTENSSQLMDGFVRIRNGKWHRKYVSLFFYRARVKNSWLMTMDRFVARRSESQTLSMEMSVAKVSGRIVFFPVDR